MLLARFMDANVHEPSSWRMHLWKVWICSCQSCVTRLIEVRVNEITLIMDRLPQNLGPLSLSGLCRARRMKLDGANLENTVGQEIHPLG